MEKVWQEMDITIQVVRTCEEDADADADADGQMAKDYAEMGAERKKRARKSIPQIEAIYRLRNKRNKPRTDRQRKSITLWTLKTTNPQRKSQRRTIFKYEIKINLFDSRI